jgi:hypothetical protein
MDEELISNDTPNPALPAKDGSCRPHFSRRSMLVSTIVICILLSILALSLRQLRREGQERRCQNNLKQIALALLNYHDVYKSFPWAITYAKGGTPMHSWRVAITPYLESQVLWDMGSYDFREPWNGPHNRVMADEIPETYRDRNGTHLYWLIPPCYRCPSAPPSQNQMCANYVMLIDDRPGKMNGPPNRPGSVPSSFDDKSAVIVIEIADSDIHWMEPRDVLLSELSMKINDRTKRSLSSYHGGACVVHADASVEILDEATTEERLRELLAQ